MAVDLDDVKLAHESTDRAKRVKDAIDGAGNTFAPVGEIQPIGTAAGAGTSGDIPRADHVHAHGNQTEGSLHAAVQTTGGGGAAGFMTSADKDKLDAIEALADVTANHAPQAHAPSHVTGGGDVIADAVAGGNSGLMSGADKSKLDGIDAGATAYNGAGDGSDGALHFDGTNTFAGIESHFGVTPNLTYKLARDVFCDTLIIDAGITVMTGGFRIHAKTSATINGTLKNDGSAGDAGGGLAGHGADAGSLAGGSAGGAGGNNAVGANGSNITSVAGGAGGAGGGGAHAGGAAGTVAAPAANEGGFHCRPQVELGATLGASGYTRLQGGSGGGGGGSDGDNSAKFGGGGGGVVALNTGTLNIGATGLISANGGKGADAAAAGTYAGGGGGGGGGAILLSYHKKVVTAGGLVTATAGAGGAGTGTGSAGTAGADGVVVEVAY